MRRLNIKADRFELVAPFRISRGERRHVDLVMATIAEAGVEGAGEGSPSSRPANCIAAVRQAAPAARLIVDANESWTIDQLRAIEPLMVDLGIELIEQPLPAAADESLCDHAPAIPIAADEALRTRADLPKVVGRYQVATIKLDKAGGLTEALATAEEASAAGLKVMTGCMLCSSLSVAAARHLAARSDLVDLDGPIWLRTDRPGGIDLRA